jgi:hypothetical protein
MRAATMAALAGLVISACGGTGGTGGQTQSPVGSVASTTPSPAAVNPADIRIVIEDPGHQQVRLTRLDATRTAVVPGEYAGVVAGQVIIVNGNTLEALSRAGTVRTLGTIDGPTGGGAVAVKSDLTGWIYTTTDDALTSYIHRGSPTGNSIVATIPSPDGNAFYMPFAWTSSGVYMVKSPTGLGGAGPFLEYRFLLAQLDLSSGKVTELTPECRAYSVLDDGTVVCKDTSEGRVEVRPHSGKSTMIQVAAGSGPGTTSAYWRVHLSPDRKRLIAGRNGAKDPVINYQMVVASLDGSSVTPFGPLDYAPDAWLPDGRVLADHLCVLAEWGGGPCNSGLDGTYIFSADGSSQTLFYKITSGYVVDAI